MPKKKVEVKMVICGDFNLGITRNALSDKVVKDLKRRGFKFMGTVTTYSYFEAIGVMSNHASECFHYHQK